MGTTKEERSLRVANMRANFAQEGGAPDAQHEALLERYIEGAATLADLYAHAQEYLYSYQERERLRLIKTATDVELQRLYKQYDAGRKAYGKEQEQKNDERRGISGEQRERHETIDSARANVELSGLTVSDEAWRDSLRYANGELSIEEYLALRTK
jgi:murein tripeptide amidase MpaA